MIPFLDLKKINSKSTNEILEVFNRVIDSGHYILGDENINFEQEFANFCETKYSKIFPIKLLALFFCFYIIFYGK